MNDDAPHPKFQLFDPLPEAQYEALRRDIERRGVLVPIEIDEETGEILDGHHRKAIADELGIKCPQIERPLATDAARHEHVLTLNLLRRHLDDVTWGEAFLRLCELRGIEPGKRGPKPNGVSATVAETAAELGVPARTARRRAATTRLPHPLKEAVRSGELSARAARRQHRNALKAAVPVVQDERPEELPEPFAEESDSVPSGTPRILRCDVASMHTHVEAQSIDAIICDPCSVRARGDVHGDLAAFAVHALRPGGVCIVLVSPAQVPGVLGRFVQPLIYHWTVACLTPGDRGRYVESQRVDSSWTPALVFSHGPYDGTRFGDVVGGAAAESDAPRERWGKAESTIAGLVRRFSSPGDLVCDPFVAAGATAVVAVTLGRRFVGCDTDKGCVEDTKRRLRNLRPAAVAS